MINSAKDFFCAAELIGKQMLDGQAGHRIWMEPKIRLEVASDLDDEALVEEFIKSRIGEMLETKEDDDDEEAEILELILIGEVAGILTHYRIFKYLETYEPEMATKIYSLDKSLARLHRVINQRFPVIAKAIVFMGKSLAQPSPEGTGCNCEEMQRWQKPEMD